MGSPIEVAAAGVLPPCRTGVFSGAATTSEKYLDLWATRADPVTGANVVRALAGRYLTLQADGGDVYFQLCTLNSDTITPSAAADDFAAVNCVKVAAGDRLDIWVPSPASKLQYLVYKTASGTATLRIWPSSSKMT